MSKRDIGVIAFKIGGLYMLLQALMGLAGGVVQLVYMLCGDSHFDISNFPSILASGSVQLAFLLVSAWYLLTKAEYLVNLVFPAGDDEKPNLAIDVSTGQMIAFSVVGLLLAALAVPDLARELLRIIFRPMTQPRYPDPAVWMIPPKRDWGRLATNIIQLTLGIWLFLGARSLSDFWWRVRRVREYRNKVDNIIPNDAGGPKAAA